MEGYINNRLRNSQVINATREIEDNEILAKSLNKLCGGDGKQDAFNDDELMEIAEYLTLYCKHQNEQKGENK